MQVTAQIAMSVRADFAHHHRRAAAVAARRAYDIETAGEANTLGPGFDEIMTCVPVSVCMAGAALEANANELIQDILDWKVRTTVMTDAHKVLLEELLENRSGNALDRYRMVALLRDRVLDRRDSAWGEAALLIAFRNFFMHFKPNWEPTDSEPKKLAAKFAKKFTLAEPYKTNAFYMFPHACLTYECAKWSVQTVLNFSQFMSKSFGIADRLSGWQPASPLP
jgi:hypothetical protein